MDIHRLIASITAVAITCTAVDAQSPPRRAHHSLVYDTAAKRVLLTGGSTPANGGNSFTFFNDLWAFDGTAWTERPASGEKMSGIGLAFDSRRSQVVSFGGYAGNSRGDVRLLSENGWRMDGSHP